MSTGSAAAKAVTSSAIIAHLRRGYDEKAYAFLEQVRGGTGSYGSRYADALVMSLWPSRGFDVYGFEVKVSRSDWLSEMRKPEKADEIYRYCNQWWLVAGDESIVRDGELPSTWGLTVFDGETLKVKRHAPALEPEPLKPAFIAAVLRSVARVNSEGLQAQYQIGYSDGREIGLKAGKSGSEYAEFKTMFERLKESVDAFEQKAGVKIETWNGRHIGESFKAFTSDERAHERIKSSIRNYRGQLERTLAEFPKE